MFRKLMTSISYSLISAIANKIYEKIKKEGVNGSEDESEKNIINKPIVEDLIEKTVDYSIMKDQDRK